MIGRTQLSEVEENSNETTDETTTDRAAARAAADEAMIRFAVNEIDNAVDAKDWELCRSFFAREVAVDFTSLSGGEPARIAAEELIAAWRTNLFAEKKSFHQRTNHRIEIDGDRAEVFSKGYAFNLLETGEAAGMWEVWGEYRHTLTRASSGWKVAAMSLTVRHTRGDDRVRAFVPPPQ